MNPVFPFAPERASSVAGEVDALFLFILGITALFAVGVWIALLYLRHPLPATLGRRSPGGDPRLARPRAHLDHHSARHHGGHVRVGGEGLLPHEPAARRRDDGERRGQALDVEAAAPDRPARDQRAARAPRPRGEARDHVRGHHPQLLRPRVPHQEGRGPRPLQHGLVPGHEGRHLPPLLRRVLRHRALEDDRAGGGDGARGLPDLARGRPAAGVAGGGGGEALHRAELHHLPPARLRRARPRPRRHLRAAR